MRSSTDFSVTWMPRAAYDPQKAHEYYERTKELKGRKKGSSPTPHVQRKVASQAQVKTAEQKVAEIKGKLERLRALLREKVAASKSDEPERKNAAQKAADAKKSKEYYDKHKESIKNDREKASKGSGGGSSAGGKTAADMTADELRTAIRNTVAQLKQAINNAQSLRRG